MIAVLARKDLRAQVPFLVFVLLVQAANWLDVVLTTYPDLASPRTALGHVMDNDGNGLSLLHFLVAFSLAVGLLLREFDEGTMEFLDGLPVSRTHIFTVRFAMGFAILAVMPLSNAALAMTRASLSATSLHPDVPFGLIATGAGLQLAQCFVFLALGLLLSFLRRFAWIGLGVLYWIYVAASTWLERVSAVNPFLLTKPVFKGQAWMVPRVELSLQLALAVACTAAAYFLFVRQGDRLGPGSRGPRSRPVRKLAAGGVAFLTIALAFSVLGHLAKDDDRPPRPGTARYASFALGRAHTARYVISYPTNLAARAQALVDGADAAHDRVLDYLEVRPAEAALISVDATGSTQGTAATTRSTKIRLDLSSSADVGELLTVLGHETTHAYIDRLSADRAATAQGSRFFHEGLATHVEYAAFRTPGERDRLRTIAAALRVRRLVDFDELLDPSALTRRLDPSVVYPLGEAFAAALVERHGRSAPARVLRALGRESARQDLDGPELWRDAFQTAGFDLDGVSGEMFRSLDLWAARYAHEIAAFPRLVGSAWKEEEWVGVDIDGDPPPGFALACRFRAREDTPRHEYAQAWATDDEDFWSCRVRRRQFSSTSFWYQLGFVELGSDRSLFEPWTEVRLD